MAKQTNYEPLVKLTQLIGPSGFESGVQEYYGQLMRSLGCRVYSDRIGNCYAEMAGKADRPKIMVNAHADTVGFMINHIDDAGFAFVKDLGPWITTDYRMLPGTDVVMIGRKKGKEVAGHFGVTIPIHALDDADLEDSIDREDLTLDFGARSVEQARRYLNVGDYGALAPSYRFSELNGTKHLTATALDDRAGLYCMYAIAQKLKDARVRNGCTITFVSTVTEEASTGAAAVAARNVKPDIALTIDTTVATDQMRHTNEDTISKTYGTIHLDKGVVIPRGVNVNDDLFLYLEGLCTGRDKIAHQIEVGTAGTENEYIQVTGEGVKSAAILMALRNLHTRVETVSLKDIDATTKLAVKFFRGVSAGKFN